MKYRSMCSTVSKSAMTPSRSGRIATMFAGVRPTIRLASVPTVRTRPVRLSIATTEGSEITTPLLRTYTKVFAVPRSMPMSLENKPRNALNGPDIILLVVNA